MVIKPLPTSLNTITLKGTLPFNETVKVGWITQEQLQWRSKNQENRDEELIETIGMFFAMSSLSLTSSSALTHSSYTDLG